MKGFLAFASLAAVACIAQGLVTKEYSSKVEAAGLKCKDELKFDEESFKKMWNDHRAPENEKEKCMLACVFKELGHLHDGKMDLAAMQESNKIKWEDAVNVENANSVSKTCVEEVGTHDNDCEMAGKMVACLFRESEKQALSASKYSNE